MVTIRRPTKDDVRGIFECLAVYNVHPLDEHSRADRNFPEDTVISVRNSISHINLFDKCWVAAEDQQIMGFCCWAWLDKAAGAAKTVLISALPEGRRLGVGKSLQRKRQDEMRERGAVEIHTWSDDPSAINWYQKIFGYEVVGYEPILHCLHRFHFNGDDSIWAIHRGFVEREQLAHLRLKFDRSRPEPVHAASDFA
jgi:ribosomal protein S18 acetylase RimI-like enzyme